MVEHYIEGLGSKSDTYIYIIRNALLQIKPLQIKMRLPVHTSSQTHQKSSERFPFFQTKHSTSQLDVSLTNV